MNETETIAIIAWGAMADVLYATPIVRHIRQLHPDAEVSWLIRDKFAEVVETNPDINHVVHFKLPDGYRSRQEAEYAMDQMILQQSNQKYDRVYDLQYWPRYSNFYEDPNEDFVSLRARNAGLDPTAITDRSVTLLNTEGDYLAATDFRNSKMSKHLDKPFITVNHISYAASPVWSLQNYSDLVDILDDEHNIMSVFTGAPHETIPEHAFDARGMPYRAWSALIADSNLWLGLDSGAVALACASNTPIIKLHSPDFPLAKTGIKGMGLRSKNVLELSPAPNVESMVDLIVGMMENARN